MSISAECPDCGGKFRAPDKLAGKRVKCPKCSAVIQVGGGRLQPTEEAAFAEAPTPHIPVACGCGKKFRAKSELAGKRVKCPACGKAFAIPGGEPADLPPLTGQSGFEQLMQSDAAAPAMPLGTQPQRQPMQTKQQQSNVKLIVGLGAGGGAVVVALLAYIVFGSSDNGSNLAEKTSPPGAGEPANPSPPASPSPDPPVSPSADPPASPSPDPPAEPEPAAAGSRSYPSFPTALLRAPAWLTDVPFDVAKFLEVPPPEENAALLYLDALFEFDDDVSCLFSPEDQQRRGPIAKRRREQLWRLYEAWQEDPASVDRAALDALLAEYETGFQKLAQAQQRPRCVFETGFHLFGIVEHASQSRQVAHAIACRTWRDLDRGDFERPIEGVETVLRLSRDLRPRGSTVSQLVSVALGGICYSEIVPQILTAEGVEAEHCDRLSATLARHEAEGIDPLLPAIRAEYMMMRVFLHDVEHHTGVFDPKVSRGRQLAEFFAWVREMDEEKPVDAEALDKAARTLEDFLAKTDFQRQVDIANRWYDAAAGMPGAPLRDQEKVAISVGEMGRTASKNKDLIAMIWPPVGTLLNTFTKYRTQLCGTQCLIALRRWQLEHDTPPPDLATVVKAAGMDAVPIDPYSDGPLQMTTVEGQPVIYSVSGDGKDDKALQEWEGDPGQTGDLIFRLQESAHGNQ